MILKLDFIKLVKFGELLTSRFQIAIMNLDEAVIMTVGITQLKVIQRMWLFIVILHIVDSMIR